MTNATQFGVWDKQFADWDSGPYITVEQAERKTYPGMPEGADKAKYRKSKSLIVREWLARGEAGAEVI